MALDADEEILQDFLVEAGEILEKLSEELVQLEQSPDDSNLLNSIFRGFHTVKGGAGFLQLDALVNCCHSAENVFDTLRNLKRKVDSDLMDVVLEALDYVNTMFEQVRQQEEPTPAPDQLIEALDRLAVPASEDEPAADADESTEAEEATEEQPPEDDDEAGADADSDSDSGDITDDEFEQLLDALEDEKKEGGGDAAKPAPANKPEAKTGSSGDSKDSDEISDDEFESLLDELHGEGKFAGPPTTAKAPAEPAGKDTAPAKKTEGGDPDLISDDEFENLLDDLHGKGGAPTKTGADKKPADKKPADKKTADKKTADKKPAAPKKPEAEKKEPAAKADKPADKPAPKAEPKKEASSASPSAPPKEAGAPVAETSVRVDTKRLDDIMNMVGELVLVRNRLQRLGADSEDEHMHKAVGNLDVVTTDLQSAVMATRMQPIKKVFGRFPRVVRDLARSMKKEINLEMHGEDTDLDKNLVEALSDPLVHLVRNSVDHGIEAPDVREKAGKPRQGNVVLSAEQEGDHILLSISDDGAGMDAEVLRRKAVEKGVHDQDAADRLTENECYNLIFAAGFSTKDQISDVSGRGVGMDVVKTKISQLNGQISVESELGKGSRIVIKVPLTLAIMPTLMIMLGEQSFALPLVNVVEIFHLDLTKKNIVDGRECIVVRDRVFPIFHVKRWLLRNNSDPEPQNGHVVIVAMGTRRVGFVVDQLIGQEEVVIKPLGRALQGTPGMAGATITGDGRIALIIDVPSLLQHYG